MDILQSFTASLTAPTIETVHAVQYDVVRQIRIRIYSGATMWPVPEGVTAGVSYTLPDKSNGYFEQLTDGAAACTIEGNEVTAVVAPILTSVAGIVKAAIVLRQGDRQLSTFPFQIRVTARPGAITKPEAQPDAASVFVGRLYYGGANGLAAPLGIGDGLEVQDGVLRALGNPDAASKGYVADAIARLWADINYKPITITAISIRPAVAQLGQEVEAPVVAWAVSREPVAQAVDAVAVGTAVREYTLPGTYSKAVTVTVTDERDATASKSVGISFYNVVYYGKQTGRAMPADEDLQRMPRKLQPGRGLTIAADAAFGEYILYAIPSRYGRPKFWCNGLQAAFEKMGTMSHTNKFGYQEDYDVWISEADELYGVEIIIE